MAPKLANAGVMECHQLVIISKLLEDADTVSMLLDDRWIQVTEIKLLDEIDSVPHCRSEVVVLGLANSSADDSILDSGKAAEQKGYLWYEYKVVLGERHGDEEKAEGSGRESDLS